MNLEQASYWKNRKDGGIALENARQKHPSQPGKELIQLKMLVGGKMFWTTEGDLHREWERCSYRPAAPAAVAGPAGPAARAAKPARPEIAPSAGRADDDAAFLARLARENPGRLRQLLQEAEERITGEAAARLREIDLQLGRWVPLNLRRRAGGRGGIKALARQAGLNPATIHGLLHSGAQSVTARTLIAIARSQCCTVEDLLERPEGEAEDTPAPPPPRRGGSQRRGKNRRAE